MKTIAIKTIHELDNQSLRLTQMNWTHFNGNSNVNVSETANKLRTNRDKLIGKAYLNSAAIHLTEKAKAISEFLSVWPMHEEFCVRLDYDSPAIGVTLSVSTPYLIDLLLNSPEKVFKLIPGYSSSALEVLNC